MENGNLYTVSCSTRRVSSKINFTSKEHSYSSWKGMYVRTCALLILKRFTFVIPFFYSNYLFFFWFFFIYKSVCWLFYFFTCSKVILYMRANYSPTKSLVPPARLQNPHTNPDLWILTLHLTLTQCSGRYKTFSRRIRFPVLSIR